MSHSELEALLDAELSLHVRGGAAVKAGSPFVRCYTCGRLSHWKDLDCGHFIPRVRRGTRWELDNLRPQCKPCNWTLEGNKDEYLARLTAEIGFGAIEDLRRKAAFYGSTRMAREWLIEQIRAWRERNRPLRRALKELE